MGAMRAAAEPAETAKADSPKKDAWIVTLRAAGIVAPSFPGAARLRPYPFPSLSFRRVGEPEQFSTPDEGFGLAVFNEGPVSAGPVANFVFRRGGRDGLFGVHQVSLTHEIGGFVELRPTEYLRARAELRQGIDGHEGFVAALGADLYGSQHGFTASIGPRLNLGDNRYANAYFSVSPQEALLNGRLTPYAASGGFTAAGGVATLRYDFNESVSATAFGGLQRLTGSVGDSSIPSTLGSRNQFSAGLSIGRSFEVRQPW
jgi:MipA family protein